MLPRFPTAGRGREEGARAQGDSARGWQEDARGGVIRFGMAADVKCLRKFVFCFSPVVSIVSWLVVWESRGFSSLGQV